MEKVGFAPKADYDRVEVAVQTFGETFVIEDGFETDNPMVIAALDNCELVKRSAVKKDSEDKS